LVLIVVAAGFYQQLQTTRRSKNSGGPPPETPQGMQTAMKIMPLFFGFISWGFPTGLVLYFATSNLFRIAQQSVILRMGDAQKKPAGSPNTAGSTNAALTEPSGTGETDPSPAPEKTGPSPNASKKRKKRRRK
jgi:YidC/Oxa1 family membrane protein insertase